MEAVARQLPSELDMSARYRLDVDDQTGVPTITTRSGLTAPAWWEGWEIQQGADLYLPINLIDGDTSTEMAVAAWTARLKLRDGYGGTVIDSLTQADGITLASSHPSVLIERTAAETAAYTFTAAVFDLELIDTGSIVWTVLSGVCSLRKEATA